MPPTAIEIKARLDKAVDQDGNVLDMEAVLEIVASLEKIIMTKESLEATRIGKTINLMRKRTSNEDLSKRAKKLVKRWQTVVSNHLNIQSKKKGGTETVNGMIVGSRKDIGSTEHAASAINGNKNLSTEKETKSASKRKRSTPDTCSAISSLKPGSSPRITSSPRLGASPYISGSKRPGVAPGLGAATKRALSPKVCSKSEPITLKTSGLVAGEYSTECKETVNISLSEELNCSDLNYSTQIGEYSQQKLFVTEEKETERCPKGNSNSPLGDFAVSKPSDTRLQENRIVLGDFISKSKPATTTATKSTERSIDVSLDYTDSDRIAIKDGAHIIEPEDLVVVRKELPEDITSPESEADGVNGVYSSKGVWSSWEANIEERNKDLLLLPYVILD